MPRKYQKKGKAKTFDVGSDWWMTKDIEGKKLGQEQKTRYKVSGKTDTQVELTKIAKGDETFGVGSNTLTITMDDFNRQMVKNLAKPQQPKPTPIDPNLTYAFISARKGEGGKAGAAGKAMGAKQQHVAKRVEATMETVKRADELLGRAILLRKEAQEREGVEGKSYFQRLDEYEQGARLLPRPLRGPKPTNPLKFSKGGKTYEWTREMEERDQRKLAERDLGIVRKGDLVARDLGRPEEDEERRYMMSGMEGGVRSERLYADSGEFTGIGKQKGFGVLAHPDYDRPRYDGFGNPLPPLRREDAKLYPVEYAPVIKGTGRYAPVFKDPYLYDEQKRKLEEELDGSRRVMERLAGSQADKRERLAEVRKFSQRRLDKESRDRKKAEEARLKNEAFKSRWGKYKEEFDDGDWEAASKKLPYHKEILNLSHGVSGYMTDAEQDAEDEIESAWYEHPDYDEGVDYWRQMMGHQLSFERSMRNNKKEIALAEAALRKAQGLSPKETEIQKEVRDLMERKEIQKKNEKFIREHAQEQAELQKAKEEREQAEWDEFMREDTDTEEESPDESTPTPRAIADIEPEPEPEPVVKQLAMEDIQDEIDVEIDEMDESPRSAVRNAIEDVGGGVLAKGESYRVSYEGWLYDITGTGKGLPKITKLREMTTDDEDDYEPAGGWGGDDL